ncbi:MAG: hypothetical protein Terrestrivirus2_151 [Terrestrivirus sp.]|uniref:Uncharacterized protein n=1 Tax=Terrestrivirus sp. TaxID=2487775 RepID=A0A3G4ZPW0_9VIRU|nr:MAG: hypothetical protein Terrestrivirus2_151 [Terrestrivirus sp.]
MLFGLTSGDFALLIVAGSVFGYVGYYLYLQLYKRYLLLMTQLNKVTTFIDRLDNLQNSLTYLVDQNVDANECSYSNWKPSKTSYDIKNNNQYTFNDELNENFKPKNSTGSILNKLLPNENNAQYYAILGSLTPFLWSYFKDYVTSRAFPTISTTNFNPAEFMKENPEITTKLQQKFVDPNFNVANFNIGEFVKENPDIATKLVEKVGGFKQEPANLNNAVLGGKYKVSPWVNSTVEPDNWANEKVYNPDYIAGTMGSTGVVGPMAPNILKNYKNMYGGFTEGYMGMEGNPIIKTMYMCPGCPGCFSCPSVDTNVKHSEPDKCSGCLKCVNDQNCTEHEAAIPKNYAEPGLSIPKFNKSFGGLKSIESTEYDECAYKSPKQSSNGTKLADADVNKINMSIEI